MRKINFHEQLNRETSDQRSSERSFGITFAAVFAIIGLVKLYYGSSSAVWWFAASSVFIALGLLYTAPLRPLNRAWYRLSLLLYTVVNPVVMALLFSFTIVPIGLALRIAGKDLLRLRLDPSASSYWILRTPPGPSPETMKNQF